MLQLSHDLTRFKEHCEEKMRGLVASTVGAMEVQQAKQRQERKVVWFLLTLCSGHVVQSRPLSAQDRCPVQLSQNSGSQSLAQGSRAT